MIGMGCNARPHVIPAPSNETKVQEAREAAIMVANRFHILNAYQHAIERRKCTGEGIGIILSKSFPCTPQRQRRKGENVRDDTTITAMPANSLDNVSHVNASDRGSIRGILEKGDELLLLQEDIGDKDTNSVEYNDWDNPLIQYAKLDSTDLHNQKRKSSSESKSTSNNESTRSSIKNNDNTKGNQIKHTNGGWRRKLAQVTKKKKRCAIAKDYSQFNSDDPSILFSKAKKATKEAFMCSYCGEIFSNHSYASNHEGFCIRKAVLSMKKSNNKSEEGEEEIEMSSQISVPRKVISNSL